MCCAFLLDEPTTDIMHNTLIFSVAHNGSLAMSRIFNDLNERKMTAYENITAILDRIKKVSKKGLNYVIESEDIEQLQEAQEQVKNIAYEPLLAPVNYKQHYIDWRDKYFSKVDKVFEYKTKNKTEYFTTEQLHKKYEKAMLESPFNGC